MKRYLLTAGLLFAMAGLTVNAQTQSGTSNAPATPPTFPSDQQNTDMEGTRRGDADADRTMSGSPEQSQTPVSTQSGSASGDQAQATTQVKSEVETALKNDARLSGSSVNVQLNNNNEIVLTGSVQNEADKNHAEQVARQAAGSSTIINQINSSGVNVSDSGTPTGSQPSTGTSGSIGSGSSSDQSTTGATSSGSTSDQSTSSGTGSMTSGGQTSSDPQTQQVKSEVQTSLQNEAELSGEAINVQVNNNNQIVLTGSVKSEDKKRKAEEVAKRAAGGDKYTIINQINTTNVNVYGSGSGTTGGMTGSADQTGASGSVGTGAGSQSTTGSSTSGSTSDMGSSTSGSSSGSMSGSASTSGMGSTAGATSEMQSQIQSAFQQQGLSGVNVNVTDSEINLSGTVETGKEKQLAKRTAQSYANGRKVNENLTVTGKGKNK